MFIVWSGFGFLTILIIPLVSGIVGGAVLALLSAAGLSKFASLAFAFGALAGAAVNWIVGKKLNGKPQRVLVDQATGERVVLSRRHRLFWIKMEYWSIPVAIFGAVLLVITPFIGAK